jgi:hypothetical protein
MNDLDKLMTGLDEQAPDWAVRNATQAELVDYVLEHERNQERATTNLRRSVAMRLTIAIRAALEAGLVTLSEAMLDAGGAKFSATTRHFFLPVSWSRIRCSVKARKPKGKHSRKEIETALDTGLVKEA